MINFIKFTLCSLFALCCLDLQASPRYETQDDRDYVNFHPILRQIKISKRDYALQENFDVDSESGHLGNVVQSSLSIRKNYKYYNHHGELVSSAYLKLPSFGSLMTKATVLNVYDARDRFIGSVEGAIITWSPSQFYFYDADGKLKGTAYMDNDRCSFTIYHPKHEQKILATYNRVFVRDVQDWWMVDIIDPEAIDPRLLITFGAFAVDTQGEYRKDD